MIRGMKEEWQAEFVETGSQALERLAQARFEVVVSDMGLPGMDGVQLLTEVRRRYPDTARIMLTGQDERDALGRILEASHQHLAKPCEPERLKNVIARACALRRLLRDEQLKRVVSQVGTLPTLPELYDELMAECRSSIATAASVAEIIGDDVGMTAKILQLVNSSYFGLRVRVANPAHAVQMLGFETVKALVLCAHVFARFDAARAGGFPMVQLWKHSLAASAFAGRVARLERADQHLVDDASVAALLHDCGQLVLAAATPARYAEAMALAAARGISLHEAEHLVFGTTNASVGAYLLNLWALPDPIVEAVAFHHAPAEWPHDGFAPLTAVHVADVFADEAHAFNVGHVNTGIDEGYLAALGLADRLEAWRPKLRAADMDEEELDPPAATTTRRSS